MDKQPFLNHMFTALGRDAEIESPVVVESKKPEPKPKKQESVPVQIMDSDMKDSFYVIGNKDLLEFTHKFMNDEFSYSTGGLFGSSIKMMNETKPLWVDSFIPLVKAGKKSKKAYFIDITDPKSTIKEIHDAMQIRYPDLIVGL